MNEVTFPLPLVDTINGSIVFPYKPAHFHRPVKVVVLPAAIELLNGQDCRQETKLSSVYKKNRLLLQEAANRKLGSNRSVSQIELSDADLLLSIAQLRVQFKSDQSARTDIPSPFASV